MSPETQIRPSEGLRHVKYEIRGRLARRAQELERQGYEIVPLNIGNPGAFGFRTPETMRLAMIENMAVAEGYCHQKGIFPAREAVVMQQQLRGVTGVSAEEVFIGNGVSELIDLCLRALLNEGDEVLIPSPDYPLWSAAVTLNGGKAIYYPCRPENDFVPDPAEIAALVTRKTRAIVVINPNNPTGAVYPRAVCEGIAHLAETNKLVVFSDEIYDQMTYEGVESIPMATLVRDTVCCTMSGLSKIYRACGYRVGWAAFPATCAAPATIFPRSSCFRRCGCARTCRRNGPCRPRSADTRASRNCSRPAAGCSNPAAPLSKRRPGAAFSRSRRPRVPCTHSCA
jgi:alanine-synthesizing transaminase